MDENLFNDSLKLLTKFLKNINDKNKPPINSELVHAINKKYMLVNNDNMVGGGLYDNLIYLIHRMIDGMKKLKHRHILAKKRKVELIKEQQQLEKQQ